MAQPPHREQHREQGRQAPQRPGQAEQARVRHQGARQRRQEGGGQDVAEAKEPVSHRQRTHAGGPESGGGRGSTRGHGRVRSRRGHRRPIYRCGRARMCLNGRRRRRPTGGRRCAAGLGGLQPTHDTHHRHQQQGPEPRELQPQRDGAHAGRGRGHAIEAGEHDADAHAGIEAAAPAAWPLGPLALRQCAQAPDAGGDEGPGAGRAGEGAHCGPAPRAQGQGHGAKQQHGEPEGEPRHAQGVSRQWTGGERAHQITDVVGRRDPAAAGDVGLAVRDHQRQHGREGEAAETHGHRQRQQARKAEGDGGGHGARGGLARARAVAGGRVVGHAGLRSGVQENVPGPADTTGPMRTPSRACSTRPGSRSRRQRWCPSGHSRSKQGAQSSGGW